MNIYIKFFYKVYKIILTLLITILSPFFVLIIRLISPVFLIRFQHIRVNRIGHLSIDVELYLCENDKGINIPKQKYIDIFFYDRKISNKVLFKKWKKLIIILPYYFVKPIVDLNNFISFDSHKYLIKPYEKFHNNHEIYHLLEETKIHLTFDDIETKVYDDFLRKCGLLKESKFVCLVVRDSAYLNSSGSKYHAHRNCNIDNFIYVSEKLTKLGYFVFRMGAIVNKKMKTKNPKIIDYATNGMRTELLDLYLCSKCDFCISTSLGLDSLTDLFRKPLLITNFVPIGKLRFERKKVITIFKHHFSNLQNQNISMMQIKELNLQNSFKKIDFDREGIKLIENTEEEIYQSALDLLQLIKKKNFKSDEIHFVDKFNLKYNNIFFKKSNMLNKMNSSVAPSYIKNNQYLIE